MYAWLSHISKFLGGWPLSVAAGLVLLVCGLGLSIPFSTRRSRSVGATLFVAGIVCLLSSLRDGGQWYHLAIFWGLALLTVGGSAAAISMRSPVYAAIWFAVSLLGTAGLMVHQQAQFIGVATVVVYAGAIVVTFLFVVMLAQPEGHETHDRLSWGRLAKPASILAGGALIGLLISMFRTVLDGTLPRPPASTHALEHGRQLASLGNELFGTHLVSVEIAGTLLLAALVGAIAIMIYGKERRSTGENTHG